MSDDPVRSCARVAVLLSGRGSNFLALREACAQGEVPAEIVVVISDRRAAAGLERAASLGIPSVAIVRHKGESRREQEARIEACLAEHRVEWICLAGYMRLLSPAFVDKYRHRVLNIHPSLLPAFPGLEVQRQALGHGVRVAGCTVHLVDEGTDSGPIVVQRCVAVSDDDTEESLAARILVEEHKAYPEALRRLLTESWQIEGRCLRFTRPDAG